MLMTFDKEHRAGNYKTNLKGELAFSSFVPTNLQDVELRYDDQLVEKIVAARLAVAELAASYQRLSAEQQKTFAKEMTQIEAKASVLLARNATDEEEAELDHMVEMPQLDLQVLQLPTLGTRLQRPADTLSDKEQADLRWLSAAIPYAFERMQKLPLSYRLLTELHDYVMHADHNYEQNPGEFRRSPNWLGAPGCTLKDARFVPPVPDDLQQGFSRLEQFIYSDSKVDPIVRIGLIHYQLEMLHPFLDGNGRLGRLLNLLLFKEYRLLSAPILPLSKFLQENDFRYYVLIGNVENFGEYEAWMDYFLGIVQQAADFANEKIAQL